jgi:hypothetical protein
MTHVTMNRREFLETGVAAGASLLIGFHLPAFERGATQSFKRIRKLPIGRVA